MPAGSAHTIIINTACHHLNHNKVQTSQRIMELVVSCRDIMCVSHAKIYMKLPRKR